MRQVLTLAAVLMTASLWTSTATAAETAECRTYDGQQWSTQGSTEIAPCMVTLDRSTDRYNADGFKFGAWGAVLLSADQYYFYTSTDNGQNWTSAGLKSDYLSRGTPPAYTAPQRAEAVVPAEPATVAAPAAEAAEAVTTSAPTTSYVAPAPAAGTGSGAICTLKYGNSYQAVGTMSLDQCVTALLSSDMPPDNNGYTYAYWGSQFMVATPDRVQVAGETRGSWRTVLERR